MDNSFRDGRKNQDVCADKVVDADGEDILDEAHTSSNEPENDPKADDPELAVVAGVEELISANLHISRDRYGVPQNHKYEMPFSRQLRRSIKEDFPIDCDLFARADSRERETLSLYFVMRAISFLIFLLAIGAVFFAYQAWFSGTLIFSDDVTSWRNFGAILGVIAVVGGSAFLVRRLLRFGFFYVMRDRARSLSFAFAKRHSDILTRITDNCYYGRRRLGPGDWTVRGRNHMKMALWNAKRAEYMDRYVTTIIWIVRVWVIFMEVFFMALMLGALGILLSAVFVSIPTVGGAVLQVQILLSLAVFLPILIYTWTLSGRKSNDFWAKEFRREVAEQSDSEEHYFDRIAKYVEDLIDESRSKEFGGGKPSPSSPDASK